MPWTPCYAIDAPLSSDLLDDPEWKNLKTFRKVPMENTNSWLSEFFRQLIFASYGCSGRWGWVLLLILSPNHFTNDVVSEFALFYWTLSIILKSEQSRRQFIPKAQNYWRILTWKNIRWSWSTADIKKHSFHPGNPKNITTFFNLHTTEPLGWNSWCHMLPMDVFWML